MAARILIRYGNSYQFALGDDPIITQVNFQTPSRRHHFINEPHVVISASKKCFSMHITTTQKVLKCFALKKIEFQPGHKLEPCRLRRDLICRALGND